MTTEKRIRMIRLLYKMARNEGYTKKLKLENVSDWNRYRKGGKTMGKSIWDKIALVPAASNIKLEAVNEYPGR